MYRTAQPEDKNNIFDIYTRNLGSDFSKNNDYFAKKFICNNTLVSEVNGHIVAAMQQDYYSLILHNHKLATSYLEACFYDQVKGSKTIIGLKEESFKQQSYKTLISLVPTDNPNEYKKFGFEPIYYQRLYTINRTDLENSSYSGVSKEFTIDELVELYNQFVKHFNGYIVRDKNYWLYLMELLTYQRYNVAIYHNDEGKAQGYMIYYIEAGKIVVKEIIYLNGLALTRLLCYGLRVKKTIQVYMSENEDLSKAYPNVKYRMVLALAGKINDFELFNRLFNCEINSSIEGFNLFKKALYCTNIY